MRRIGVLMSVAADGPEGQARLAAFLKGLSNWAGPRAATCGSTTAGAPAMPSAVVNTRQNWSQLGPDVILASGDPVMALQQATRTVPIVFTIISDPVGAGLVESLARPGGNITGFMSYEHGFGAKWLELLKEIAPGVKRAAVIRNADESAGIAQFAGIQGVAPALAWN